MNEPHPHLELALPRRMWPGLSSPFPGSSGPECPQQSLGQALLLASRSPGPGTGWLSACPVVAWPGWFLVLPSMRIPSMSPLSPGQTRCLPGGLLSRGGACCPPPASPPCLLVRPTLTDLRWLRLELGLCTQHFLSAAPSFRVWTPQVPHTAASVLLSCQSCLKTPGRLPAPAIPLLDWNPGLSGAHQAPFQPRPTSKALLLIFFCFQSYK